MSTRKAESWNRRNRRLHFGDIILVPVADRNYFPYDQPWNANKWHVPGRDIKSTSALVELANINGVRVTLVEHDGDHIRSTVLNPDIN